MAQTMPSDAPSPSVQTNSASSTNCCSFSLFCPSLIAIVPASGRGQVMATAASNPMTPHDASCAPRVPMFPVPSLAPCACYRSCAWFHGHLLALACFLVEIDAGRLPYKVAACIANPSLLESLVLGVFLREQPIQFSVNPSRHLSIGLSIASGAGNRRPCVEPRWNPGSDCPVSSPSMPLSNDLRHRGHPTSNVRNSINAVVPETSRCSQFISTKHSIPSLPPHMNSAELRDAPTAFCGLMIVFMDLSTPTFQHGPDISQTETRKTDEPR
ncbi:hypothetical protein EDB81DRAFT_14481 [Dactylonectria macrodidyma]|uniref:Uncharacterized protein n=1 Tax=Dactylonectria macrodidyma TaxID=307937 RepID=A0A9P9FTB1_9HYPO|nr:hypothetical protein EDB81DRAFT_14481 [Dactylonectria macrodidyma]